MTTIISVDKSDIAVKKYLEANGFRAMTPNSGDTRFYFSTEKDIDKINNIASSISLQTKVKSLKVHCGELIPVRQAQ